MVEHGLPLVVGSVVTLGWFNGCAMVGPVVALWLVQWLPNGGSNTQLCRLTIVRAVAYGLVQLL